MLITKLDGFKSNKKSKIRVSAGKTLTIDFMMELGQIDVEVIVTGVPALIDINLTYFACFFYSDHQTKKEEW